MWLAFRGCWRWGAGRGARGDGGGGGSGQGVSTAVAKGDLGVVDEEHDGSGRGARGGALVGHEPLGRFVLAGGPGFEAIEATLVAGEGFDAHFPDVGGADLGDQAGVVNDVDEAAGANDLIAAGVKRGTPGEPADSAGRIPADSRAVGQVPVDVSLPAEQQADGGAPEGDAVAVLDGVDPELGGDFIILPELVAEDDAAVIAHEDGFDAIGSKGPEAIDDLSSVLDLIHVGPVDAVGQEPDVVGDVIDGDGVGDDFAVEGGGSENELVDAGVEVVVGDFGVEVSGVAQADVLGGSDGECHLGAAIEGVGERGNGVGLAQVAQDVNPGLGDAEGAEGLIVAIPDIEEACGVERFKGGDDVGVGVDGDGGGVGGGLEVAGEADEAPAGRGGGGQLDLGAFEVGGLVGFDGGAAQADGLDGEGVAEDLLEGGDDVSVGVDGDGGGVGGGLEVAGEADEAVAGLGGGGQLDLGAFEVGGLVGVDGDAALADGLDGEGVAGYLFEGGDDVGVGVHGDGGGVGGGLEVAGEADEAVAGLGGGGQIDLGALEVGGSVGVGSEAALADELDGEGVAGDLFEGGDDVDVGVRGEGSGVGGGLEVAGEADEAVAGSGVGRQLDLLALVVGESVGVDVDCALADDVDGEGKEDGIDEGLNALGDLGEGGAGDEIAGSALAVGEA